MSHPHPLEKTMTVNIEKKPLYGVVKRILDMSIAFIGLMVCMPLLLMIAICIKVESRKGSVIFKQIRIGKNGKRFSIYKFRSMVCDAEKMLDQLADQNEVEGKMFKMKNDPRVTRVGRWIRKTSIDELPQLWNVLKGDMSIVGPRPPLPDEVATYTWEEKLRLTVVPGCTGLWQVSGRSNVGFEQMVKMDIHYIQHRNTWLDMKIILKTFQFFLGSKNAF
ncbi:sugar transferase [Longirhabdus pacifica]|uniref:sugar transferase n=1 Tax=Longirhabdus pacifica TaxID=2305227 RepID=UPI001F0CAD19